MTFCLLKGAKDPPWKALLHPAFLSHMPHSSPSPERAHLLHRKALCLLPLDTAHSIPLACLSGWGLTRRFFKCSLMGQGGATFAAAPFLSLCRGSLVSASSLLPRGRWGSCPLSAERGERGKGLEALVNCHTSLWESKGARTRLCQPFLLDAASRALSPELTKVGRVKKQYSLHIPVTTEFTKLDLGFVKVTRVSDLFSVWNMREEKQLAQGVRCSHVYLLSTLEDFVLSSLLLPQISFKNKPITNFGGYFTIPAPKRLSWCRTGYSWELVSTFKVNGFLCVLVSTVGEKNIEILCKKIYSFL